MHSEASASAWAAQSAIQAAAQSPRAQFAAQVVIRGVGGDGGGDSNFGSHESPSHTQHASNHFTVLSHTFSGVVGATTKLPLQYSSDQAPLSHTAPAQPHKGTPVGDNGRSLQLMGGHDGGGGVGGEQ